MRFLFALLLLLSQHTAPALETRLTAMTALKLLPPGAAAQLARIEARDGDPAPERWHILVHDPAAPRGLREYVVADGSVVADRELSQFAETLSAADVIGSSAIRIDSDKVARELQQLAAANSARVHSLNYALHKGADAKTPVWSVSGVDDQGRDIGTLVISATAGGIVSRDGFPIDPAKDNNPSRTARVESGAKKRAQSDESESSRSELSDEAGTEQLQKPVAKKTRARREPSRDDAPVARRDPRRTGPPPEPVAEGPAPEVRRAAPVDEYDEPSRRSTVRRVFRRLLPF
jgi:hypothetical protein